MGQIFFSEFSAFLHNSQANHATILIANRVTVGNAPESVMAEMIAENTFANPKYAILKRLGKWTGNTPSRLHLWEKPEPGKLALPRGYIGNIIKLLKKHGIEYTITDRTACPRTPEIAERGGLFPFQEEALEKWLHTPNGTLEAPCGSGKTNMLLSAIARLKTTALILVHTDGLFDQTVERCRDWLGVEPGTIKAEKWKIAPVTVGMVQTLVKRDLEKLKGKFGTVIADECHHSPSSTFREVLEQLDCSYRYGVTATPFRKDRMQFLIWRVIGPVTARVTREQVEAENRLVWPDYAVIDTDYYYQLTTPSHWPLMLNDLTRNEERNHMVESTVRDYLTGDTQALILTERIEHAKHLSMRMANLDPVCLTGELKRRQRLAAMERIRAGAALTIATIQMLGEGIDVPGWDILFLVSPIAGGPRTVQAIGRVARPAPGKDRALVVDFVDRLVEGVREDESGRRKIYHPLANAYFQRRRLHRG